MILQQLLNMSYNVHTHFQTMQDILTVDEFFLYKFLL
jgi:hypothetical protein